MKLSNATLLSLAATAIAAPVATVTVHEHVKHTVVVEGYVYIDGSTTSTGYRTIGADGSETSVVDASTAVPTTLVTLSASTTPTAIANAAQDVVSQNTASSAVEQPTETSTPTTSTGAAPTTSTEAAPTASTEAAPATTSSTSSASSTSSTAAATTSASSDSSLSSFASGMLDEHNAKRSLHKDTPSLSWSADLASYAQNYADNYDCSGSLTHSGGQYGENLALGYGTTGAVDAWYNEIKDYDFSSGDYSSSTGHFTQVVWKSTTKVGCGIKECGGVWGDYIICSYDPAGNMLGDFASNVEPLA
ncbi:unnamed protein product [Kluyveromyces dobzhanskii CBS 2104]|uniref:WGS project CCBQ000000000 data, contig 00098 n=1 Tax=Kluyveromyces dobzhanskii CBS 2104 TaxID=1427455 RepID=A0A0A8L362_9SACH|nr:unnamed protein product [Kluyveromyces dobzhanskii CBS 2104]